MDKEKIFVLGIDLDGTIDRNPKFYKHMMKSYMDIGYVNVITARPVSETLITIKYLESLEIDHSCYDLLQMCTFPHLFARIDEKTCHFYEDWGTQLFKSMAERSNYIDELRDSGKLKQLDDEKFSLKLAKWKAQVCLDYGVTVMIDDNQRNIEELNKVGIYTLQCKGW